MVGADKHPTSKVMLSIEEARERLRDAGWLGPIENRVWTDEHGEIIARYKGSEPDVPEGVVKSGWEGESVTSAALVGFDRENR